MYDWEGVSWYVEMIPKLKILDYISEVLAVILGVLISIVIIALSLGMSFIIFAGVLGLWINLFGFPESIWTFALAAWIVHVFMFMFYTIIKVVFKHTRNI